MNKEKINFVEFVEISKKLEITIGRIITAERIPKSTKLLKLTVSFNNTNDDAKTVVTNLGADFEPEQFIGLVCPFVMNLTPTLMMGVTSECMIMVGENLEGKIEFGEYSVGTKLM